MMTQRMSRQMVGAMSAAVLLAFGATACKKKTPAPPPVVKPPEPKPAPPKPSVSFSANPSSIERGKSSTLRWESSNATEVRINNGIGTVQASGTREVFPNNTTTYEITATGPGGVTTATTTVSVTAPPPRPSISFSADPSSIRKGASSTLRWDVANATNITIEPGIGTVGSTGTRGVNPDRTTTYTLTARGPGGTSTSTATVNVTEISLAERLANEVQDIYFDYDKSEIREDARATLTRNADAIRNILRDFPTAVLSLEGHCDERGSAEYNLGLGDRRATATRDFLVQLGVGADKLKTISYGKERPQCSDQNETCYQKNRRAHFSAGQ